jgi:hypothetical protein
VILILIETRVDRRILVARRDGGYFRADGPGFSAYGGSRAV